MEKYNPKNKMPDHFKPIYDVYRLYAIPAILACAVVVIGILPMELGFAFAQSPVYGRILIFLVFFIGGFIGIVAVKTKSIPFFLNFSLRGIPAIILGLLFTGLCWWFSFNLLIP